MRNDKGYGPYESSANFLAYLEDLYCARKSIRDFEVIFVAFGNNEESFNAIFSRMPWLAIPYEDENGRHLFERKFSMRKLHFSSVILFDPKHRVFLDDPQF